jgi:putative ABC transport system permease protein
VKLLSRDFARVVVLANLIAWPLAYYLMNGWLLKFPYRIEVGAGPFVLCGLLTLTIALGTVSYQAIRAALADPIDSLRWER